MVRTEQQVPQKIESDRALSDRLATMELSQAEIEANTAEIRAKVARRSPFLRWTLRRD